MAKSLVIVESPAKAKTIGKYLGKQFVVKASLGHVKDLPKKDLSVDVEHDFTPKYEVIEGKTKLMAELRAAVKDVDNVYLAADPDREGEAICWHLQEELESKKPVPANSTSPHVKYWDDIQESYYALTSEPGIRSIVIDNGSTLWDYCRLAHHGRLSKVQAREFGEPNRDMSEMYNACGKNMIITHRASEEWKDNKATGKDKLEGYKETPYLCNVSIEHYRKDNGVFGIRILSSTANGDYYEGAPDEIGCLNGDDCTFPMLGVSIYPETSPEDWE